jgi:hypothetical protein
MSLEDITNTVFKVVITLIGLGVICTSTDVSDKLSTQAKEIREEMSKMYLPLTTGNMIYSDVQDIKKQQKADHDVLIKMATKMGVETK